MIKQVLESIDGISIMPIISLVVFFTFFIVMLVWALRRNKKDDEYMLNLPLEDNDTIIN